MEQQEQLPQTDAPQEPTETSAAKASGEQAAENVAENPPDTDENKESSIVTESQATIKIEGQEFELEAALAQDDKLLKTILQPHFASVENANITRDVKEGKLTVTIVKKAQHKGWNKRQGGR